MQIFRRPDDVFAKIMVILPSTFTGGAVRLSDDDSTVAYDHIKDSDYETSVLSWRTDVTSEAEPIMSGYRLALSYNLICSKPTPPLRPVSSNHEQVVDRFCQILRRWNAYGTGIDPDKIVIPLTHNYSPQNLHAHALEGIDSHHVAALGHLVAESDSHMGLGTLVCAMNGDADDDPDSTSGVGMSLYLSRCKTEDCTSCGHRRRSADCVPFADNDMTDLDQTVIEGLVDLDGETICKSIFFDEEEGTPENLCEIVCNGRHYKQELVEDPENVSLASLRISLSG